jgi:glycosyltransferase involved in cell wall biosynthesis
MNHDLAIIIPAYKDKFLEKSLASLASQTNKGFNVYIGDDNSPFNLKLICDKFKSLLNITYVKFDNNIGGKDIIEQWVRCIALSKHEQWIWLFSDDDIADEKCVDQFFSTIKGGNGLFDVYRFNTRVINDDDEVIAEAQESPFIDTAVNMAYNILLGKRGNSMPDHIFSRAVYNKYGFVRTDWAQGADWATSIQFSTDKGICTIPYSKVNWRLGDYNISGTVHRNRYKKIRGHIQFLMWVIDYFKYLEEKENPEISYYNILRATDINLRLVIENHYKGLSLYNFIDIYNFFRMKNLFFRSLYKVLRFYYRIYVK